MTGTFLLLFIFIFFLVSRFFLIAHVQGNSMARYANNGDIVVADRFFFRLTGIRKGQTVIFRLGKIDNRLIFKRISHVRGSGRVKFFFLSGDNQHESVDSRHFGWLNSDDIYARVLLVIPLSRLKPLKCLARYLSFCYAWGGTTHVLIANIIHDEIRRAPGDANGNCLLGFNDLLSNSIIPGRLDRRLLSAISANPDYFRTGAVGPDCTPDLPFSLTPTHEFNGFSPHCPDFRAYANDAKSMLNMMYQPRWENIADNDDESRKELAYWAGWLVHYACDVYGHHWVGKLAGGDFLSFIPHNIREADIIRRHLAVESYLNSYIKDRKFVFAGFDTGEIMDETALKLPYPYLRNIFFNNNSGPCRHLKGCPMTPKQPIDLMTIIYDLANWHETERIQASNNYNNAFRFSPTRQLWRLVRNWHESRRDESYKLMNKYLDCGKNVIKIFTKGGFISLINAFYKYDAFFESFGDYLNPLDNVGDAVLGGAFTMLENVIDSIFGSITDFLAGLIPEDVIDALQDISDFFRDVEDHILDNTIGRIIPEDIYHYLRDRPAGLLPDELATLRDTLPFYGNRINLSAFPAFYNSYVLAKRLLCFTGNQICDYNMLGDVDNIDCRNQYTETSYALQDIQDNGVIPLNSNYYRYFYQMEDLFVAPKTYIGNRRTLEVHVDNCFFASVMRASNRVVFNNVNDALNQGYNGCAHCLLEYDTDLP